MSERKLTPRQELVQERWQKVSAAFQYKMGFSREEVGEYFAKQMQELDNEAIRRVLWVGEVQVTTADYAAHGYKPIKEWK